MDSYHTVLRSIAAVVIGYAVRAATALPFTRKPAIETQTVAEPSP